jgi:hypothetical protein
MFFILHAMGKRVAFVWLAGQVYTFEQNQKLLELGKVLGLGSTLSKR